MASKELLIAASNLASLPLLTSVLLNCIDVSLRFDDSMEAQVKLREIENLLVKLAINIYCLQISR